MSTPSGGSSSKFMQQQKTPFGDRKNVGAAVTPFAQKSKSGGSGFNSFLTPNTSKFKQPQPQISSNKTQHKSVAPSAVTRRWFDDERDVSFRSFDPYKCWADMHIPTDEQLNRIIFPPKEFLVFDDESKNETPIIKLQTPPSDPIDFMADLHIPDMPSIDELANNDGYGLLPNGSEPPKNGGAYF